MPSIDMSVSAEVVNPVGDDDEVRLNLQKQIELFGTSDFDEITQMVDVAIEQSVPDAISDEVIRLTLSVSIEGEKRYELVRIMSGDRAVPVFVDVHMKLEKTMGWNVVSSEPEV